MVSCQSAGPEDHYCLQPFMKNAYSCLSYSLVIMLSTISAFSDLFPPSTPAITYPFSPFPTSGYIENFLFSLTLIGMYLCPTLTIQFSHSSPYQNFKSFSSYSCLSFSQSVLHICRTIRSAHRTCFHIHIATT